ncbi:MAG: hypothetical protein ACOC7U_06705 [Spirochaetota bacterium]
MKLKLLAVILILTLLSPLGLEARRLYYAEEFYLYVLNLYYTSPNLNRNIRFMQWALEAPFDNPVRSLALIKTEDDFKRYKALFKMHVNLLIIDSYLQLARRFDKPHIYFFNLQYAEQLKESFTVARYYYQIVLNYWKEAKKYSNQAEAIPARINLDAWEDEHYSIQSEKLDYQKVVEHRLKELEAKLARVENYLNSSISPVSS